MTDINPAALSPAPLAYLGDAALELLTRDLAVRSGIATAAALNDFSRRFVTAVAQSDALANILPLLTEEETDIYRRGRNAHLNVPKSASAAQYHRATGLECVFGYLHLLGRDKRMRELFAAGYGFGDTKDNKGENIT